MEFDRNHAPTHHRLAGLVLLMAGAALFPGGPAIAQSSTLPSTKATPAQTAQSGHRTIPSTGVIVPQTTIDPGMKVKAPKMPAQSTPIIRPERTPPNDGSVVVPR